MPMKRDELIQHLRRNMVETGSLVCLGCGRENSCSTRGCRILREAADQLAVDATLMECKDDEIAKLREAVDRQAEELEFLHQRVEADKKAILIMGAIRSTVALDLAGIVRCGECEKAKSYELMQYCRLHKCFMRDHDFCSYGLRREEVDENASD